MDENGHVIPECTENMSGEIQVKGKSIFKEYWHREHATKDAFTSDGWFKTGDVAEWTHIGGYKILGRNSVDIIKTGGYKVSALEVEEVILRHPKVQDCAVLGIPDDVWGQRVVVLIQPVEHEVSVLI